MVQKLRPQVLVAIVILGAVSVYSLSLGINEISGVSTAGIIALAKDVITTDAGGK